ncbi:hypothetical protein ACWF95_42020 [Streptomyces vinaceus]
MAAAAVIGGAIAPAAHASATPPPPPPPPVIDCGDNANPFAGMKLEGLRAGSMESWPSRCKAWHLMLTPDRAARHYSGGTFFAYYPDTGEFQDFLLGDILERTVDTPGRVVLSPVSDGRLEVRYGNPGEPRKARIIASATPRKGH